MILFSSRPETVVKLRRRRINGGSSLKDVREEALLYDFYGGLLKGRQKEIFEASVMEDLSLSEISEEQGISRQAVSASLKRSRSLLSAYEEELGLISRFMEMKTAAEEIKETAKKNGGAGSKEIIKLADTILGDL